MKGVVIGQLLVSIIGVGALFAMYSQNFPMAHFWALILILFAFALTLADLVGRLGEPGGVLRGGAGLRMSGLVFAVIARYDNEEVYRPLPGRLLGTVKFFVPAVSE